MKKCLKKNNQLRYLKFLVQLKMYDYFKNMAEENISQEFRRKNIDETKNHLIEQINRNELMNKKQKKICTTLNYIEDFLILASTITGCISISAFCFFSKCSNRIYEFCYSIKNLCNNCSN